MKSRFYYQGHHEQVAIAIKEYINALDSFFLLKPLVAFLAISSGWGRCDGPGRWRSWGMRVQANEYRH